MQPMTHEELESRVRQWLPIDLHSEFHGKLVCINISRPDGKKLKPNHHRAIAKFCEEQDGIDKLGVTGDFVRIHAKHMDRCRQVIYPGNDQTK